MISTAMFEALCRYVPEENIKRNVPLKQYTTFRTGGPADCLIEMETEEQLIRVIRYLNIVEYPYFVIGNGSNLLVSDKGYQGVILHIGEKMSKISVDGTRLVVQAGVLMSRTARIAM